MIVADETELALEMVQAFLRPVNITIHRLHFLDLGLEVRELHLGFRARGDELLDGGPGLAQLSVAGFDLANAGVGGANELVQGLNSTLELRGSFGHLPRRSHTLLESLQASIRRGETLFDALHGLSDGSFFLKPALRFVDKSG